MLENTRKSSHCKILFVSFQHIVVLIKLGKHGAVRFTLNKETIKLIKICFDALDFIHTTIKVDVNYVRGLILAQQSDNMRAFSVVN